VPLKFEIIDVDALMGFIEMWVEYCNLYVGAL